MFNSKASVNIVSLLSTIRKTFIFFKCPLKTILSSNDNNCKLKLKFIFIVYILSCEKFVLKYCFFQKPSTFPVPDMTPMNSTCQLGRSQPNQCNHIHGYDIPKVYHPGCSVYVKHTVNARILCSLARPVVGFVIFRIFREA